MSHIEANVTVMFATIDPCYVSGSQFELGEAAASITWRNALAIAETADRWLRSDRTDAIEGMREWARETGAWDRAEIEAWPDNECLGIFAQNIASELREHLDSDNDLDAGFLTYEATNWDNQSTYPIGSYYMIGAALHVQYYTGI